MNNQQWIDQCKAQATKDFCEHVATLHESIIEWKRPGTGLFAMQFIIHSRWLIVVGDCGEAVYEWSEPLSLPLLQSCSFGYFFSKCQASPSGSKFVQWDNEVAYDNLQDWLADKATSSFYGLRDISMVTIEKETVQRCVRDLYDMDLIDAEDASYLHDCGNVPDVRAVNHFVGLQLAIKQL